MKAAFVFLGAMLFMIAALIAVRYSRARTAAQVARTTVNLIVRQSTSTGYFSIFKQWPRSIQDFTRNPSNIYFVPPEEQGHHL